MDMWMFDNTSKRITLRKVMLLPNLLLQKCSYTSSNSINKDQLVRLQLLEDRKVNTLLSEYMAIHKTTEKQQ